MGHTLVARLRDEDQKMLHTLLSPYQIPKIPYGRKCDREIADQKLPYHITLVHWGKHQDAYFLPLLDRISFTPCSVIATKSDIMFGEENSLLLFLELAPTEEFHIMCDQLASSLHTNVTSFLHITLAVDKNHDKIRHMKQQVDSFLSYPFALPLEGLDLYHIWNPVRKSASFGAITPLR